MLDNNDNVVTYHPLPIRKVGVFTYRGKVRNHVPPNFDQFARLGQLRDKLDYEKNPWRQMMITCKFLERCASLNCTVSTQTNNKTINTMTI